MFINMTVFGATLPRKPAKACLKGLPLKLNNNSIDFYQFYMYLLTTFKQNKNKISSYNVTI